MKNELFLKGYKIMSKKWRLAQQKKGPAFEAEDIRLQGYIEALTALKITPAFFKWVESFDPELIKLEELYLEALLQPIDVCEYMFNHELLKKW